MTDLKEKASALSVFLSGTQYQSKLELLMANTKGRLNGIEQWEKELNIIKMKYSGPHFQNWLKK